MASTCDKGFRIRPATAADLPALRPVFEAAKGIMRADGNAEQWSAPGFPPDNLLLRDIAREGGFVIENRWPVEAGHDEEKTVMPGLTGHLAAPRIVAYFALLHGIFSTIIDYATSRFAHLRIDTHRDNRIMQHLIEKHGFTYCGIIWLEDGTERLAYER